MIGISAGRDVMELLRRVQIGIENYREAVICSPFIDPPLMLAVADLAQDARRTQCGLRVITTPITAKALRAMLPGHSQDWESTIVIQPRLHAKVYVAIARTDRASSEAIVTSANLTLGGVASNLEFGIRIVSTSESGVRLLRNVHHFVRRLAA